MNPAVEIRQASSAAVTLDLVASAANEGAITNNRQARRQIEEKGQLIGCYKEKYDK